MPQVTKKKMFAGLSVAGVAAGILAGAPGADAHRNNWSGSFSEDRIIANQLDIRVCDGDNDSKEAYAQAGDNRGATWEVATDNNGANNSCASASSPGATAHRVCERNWNYNGCNPNWSDTGCS